VHRNKFIYNKTNQMHQFPKFTPTWNSTCFGHSSAHHQEFMHCTLGTGICHTLLKTAFEQDQDRTAVPSWSCSKAVFKPVWHIPVPSVQWINSWWWIEELSETCRVSCRSKFVKLVHLFGFIIKKFFYDARSHERKFDHVSYVLLRSK
jgi:hypothetical protein